jgi:anti-sigma B factor antagonist
MRAANDSRWKLEAENLGDETRVWFRHGSVWLDEVDAADIEARLDRLIEESGRCRLVLDLGNVSYLTSTILGVFLRLQRTLHTVGGGLVLVNAMPQIREIFAITRLDQVLEIRDVDHAGCAAS